MGAGQTAGFGGWGCRQGRGFKAFGVNAPLWELTLLLAPPRTADAGDVPQGISQSAAEDVALVSGHLQWLLDGVCEEVLCKTEVGEHSGS